MDNLQHFTARPAKVTDVPAILSMIRELADYEHLLDEVIADEALLTDWLFTRPRAEVLMAEEGGEPVGYALFFHNFSTFLGRSGIYLEDLYIRPQHRGHGYGKALLQTLARLAVDRECGRLEWACLDWNEPSIRFYRSLGAFTMDGWTTFRLTGEALRENSGNGLPIGE